MSESKNAENCSDDKSEPDQIRLSGKSAETGLAEPLKQATALQKRLRAFLDHPRYKLAQKVVWAACIIWAGCIIAGSIPYYIYIGQGKQACLQGKFKEAEELFLLAAKETRSDPPDDPRKANALNNLGELYRSRAEFAKAQAIYNQLQEIVLKLDKKKKEQAVGYNNIAAFYRDKGDFASAETLVKRGLSIWEADVKKLDDPVYAALNQSLGRIYKEKGGYKESEQLYLKAIAIRKKVQGEKHADLAAALSSLGSLYRKQGRYEEAEKSYKKALEIDIANYGFQHPDTATDLNNYAGLLRDLKRYNESEKLYTKALETRRLLLGDNHPFTAKSLLGLGELKRAQENSKQSRELIELALKTDKSAFGSDKHPDCADCYNALGQLYLQENNLPAARNCFSRCLQLRKELLGAEHPDTAETLFNLAETASKMKHFEESKSLYEKALSIQSRSLNPEHPAVQASKKALEKLSSKTKTL